MSGKKLLYSVHTISKYTKLQSWIQIEEEEKIQGGQWIQILQNFGNGYILTEIPNKWIKIIHYVREEVFMYTLFQFPGTDAKYKKLQRWIQINNKKIQCGYRYYKISEMDTNFLKFLLMDTTYRGTSHIEFRKYISIQNIIYFFF